MHELRHDKSLAAGAEVGHWGQTTIVAESYARNCGNFNRLSRVGTKSIARARDTVPIPVIAEKLPLAPKSVADGGCGKTATLGENLRGQGA